MKLTFLGGTDEIGASAILLEAAGARVLVDCGIRMGARAALPELDMIASAGGLTAIVVTHGHLDHIGALPVVHRSFPDVPVYATPPTIALAQVMLRDAAKIMSMDDAREEEIPLYSLATVDALLARMLPVRPDTPEPIAEGLAASFFLCGHIIGAAAVGLQTDEGHVLFTGDISWTDQLSVAGMRVPPFRPDVLVIESTYGDRLHADRRLQEDALAANVAEAVSQGRTVLIPAFAVGRAQEVLLILRRAMRLGRIPAFPVWVDGLVRPVCGLYTQFAAYLRPKLRSLIERAGDPFFADVAEINPVESPEHRLKIADGPPCAIVASSGMLSGGASAFYASRLVTRENALITITGYQDEEAPGRRLIEAAEGRTNTLTILGREMPIACSVGRYQLSAHADATELAGLATRLRPAHTVIVHGGAEGREGLARQLATEPVGRLHLPARGTSLQLRGRRRRVHTLPGGIGGGRTLAEGAAALADQVLELRGELASWPVARLLRMWGTEGMPLEEAERILADSGRFVRDPRRPFTLKALPEGAAPAHDPVKDVLAEIGAAQGLYRHSVDRTAHTLTLRFHFPKVAEARHRARIEEILAPHGWTCVIHPSVHSGVLVARAGEVAAQLGVCAVKTSLRIETSEVVVRVDRAVDAAACTDIREAFRAQTGFTLLIEQAPATCLPAQARRADGRLEINSAFSLIDARFREEPHRPYRKRLLGGQGGCIELCFISPRVGAKYRALIDALAAESGWKITIAPQANQHRIKEIAHILAQGYGMTLEKSPSYFGDRHVLRVHIKGPPPPETLQELARRFTEETGFELEAAAE